MNSQRRLLVSLAVAAATLIGGASARAATAALRFDFGAGAVQQGFTAVGPGDIYAEDRGYGFEAGATLVATGPRTRDALHDGVTSDEPFFFTVRLPAEGNYRVTVTLGDPETAATTTIKAELRRLMLEKVVTRPGEFVRRSFIVNTRTPQIAAHNGVAAGEVRLKAPRETTQEAVAWDHRLTLEFSNARPAVCAVEIEPAGVPTIFLIGDSTVCDQSREPYNSWGQMLTRFFKPEVAIANHGESGETYRDSIGRRRLDKMISVMRPGDWMFMQFGHNDQKQIARDAGGPFTTYKDEIRQHVDAVRKVGGHPVIVSPMERRNFGDDGRLRPSLADHAAAARQAAGELKVPFIDLNAMSIVLYEALGPEKSVAAFAVNGDRVDNTHHNNFGSYELAQCITRGIREAKLPIARYLADDVAVFDPAHPDSADSFAVPPSPRLPAERPLGD